MERSVQGAGTAYGIRRRACGDLRRPGRAHTNGESLPREISISSFVRFSERRQDRRFLLSRLAGSVAERDLVSVHLPLPRNEAGADYERKPPVDLHTGVALGEERQPCV
ncbi:hypothetical protein SKAU_G00230190 [Synaphobranchus kaupii]|uniref:Uncharacterized protein n=1 Tax=Synaphobranchus kaupii TaxID=118154 RepID=A0A9Q1F5I0_SYNKA|nr:hypothetical protein SKAU_G00230190 [Synaphobranchus kaupii]